MTVIAGIDEAGFGPVLGPLVVSAAAFEVPDAILDQSLWQSLSGSVGRKPSKKQSLIPIADSKKLYSGLRGSCGLENLERGVLAMLACAGHRPACLGELLSCCAPAALKQAREYLWYQDLSLQLPHQVDATSLRLDGNSLLSRMNGAGIRMLFMRSEPVLEGEYNRLVTAVDNKSVVLFDVAARLLMAIWQAIPRGEHARIYVDHQGGRVHYLDGLRRVFDGCQFKVNEEIENLSDYTIFDDQRTLRVQFLTKGEDCHLPVALASMLSKYIRELFMRLFNQYWAKHLPDIEPTAGYYTDGNRFYQQIQPLLAGLGVAEQSLYRCR